MPKELQEALAEHIKNNLADLTPAAFQANMMQTLLQVMLNEEFEKFLGVKKHERSDSRQGYRNGTYARGLKTKAGSIVLNVPRDRDGFFCPQLFEKFKRIDKALALIIAEMFLDGLGTRKIDKLALELFGEELSKSSVSRIVVSFDEERQRWRERSLEREYIYLVLDARYEKVRENQRIVSKAFVTVVGITSDCEREIIGVYVIDSESLDGWESVFIDLKKRGLCGVRYVVSDENKALRLALQKHFQRIVHQRCQTHYMRNLIGKVGKSDKQEVVELLQIAFASETKQDALEKVKPLKEFLRSKGKDKVADWIEETIEEALLVYELPKIHQKQMKSTNMVERLNQTLKKRSRVIRIFPNEASCLRILSALCQQVSEDWIDKKYLDASE